MLGSSLQQLAGSDRVSKLDAYMMLTRAWKASNNLPDRVALQEKMGLVMQFMQRDIVSKTPEGAIDSSLVNHALNLLITFLGFPAIASTITNDFGIFIIDHCIRSFEDASVPKDVARHLLHVISMQNFPAKVMTSDRVGRLVASLHNLEKHIKGKTIIMSRVVIYKKLVKQTKQLMVIHSDWLYDMFTDMLSTVDDIRSTAISLGLTAAFTVGHEKALSRKVVEVFNTTVDEQRYIGYYEERLKSMAKDKHESRAVPDIWSVVILLLRIPLDKWELSPRWLHIIQSCFNSGDFPTKVSANHAWNRLVYLMHLESRSFANVLPTLIAPLTGQIKPRKNLGKHTDEFRQTILGGICNLYYYTFKPNTNPALLDGYWATSVKPVMTKLLDPKAETAQESLEQAAAILAGLFDCTTPRRWSDDHIAETPVVKPEELPSIDPKWIRQNAVAVFATVEPILERDFQALADNTSITYRLWQTLVTTVASAASKEIKVSKDTATFVAEAINILQKVWTRGLPDGETVSGNAVGFLTATREFLAVMIKSLTLLPFIEKPGKNRTTALSPLHNLFSFLSALPPGISDNNDYADFFGSTFAPFLTQKNDKARFDFARKLLEDTIPMQSPRPYGPWLFVTRTGQAWLGANQSSHSSTGSGTDASIGTEYRDIVRFLERGIRLTPNLPWDHWHSLFFAFVERAREDTGDAGVAIAVVEPLAQVATDQFTIAASDSNATLTNIRYVIELLSVSTQPRDRQAVEAAKRRLWGTPLAGARSASFDTFSHLYKAVNAALSYTYTQFDASMSDVVVHLITEVGTFFERCNRQLFLKTMISLQDGFIQWLQDPAKRLGSQTGALNSTVCADIL